MQKELDKESTYHYDHALQRIHNNMTAASIREVWAFYPLPNEIIIFVFI